MLRTALPFVAGLALALGTVACSSETASKDGLQVASRIGTDAPAGLSNETSTRVVIDSLGVNAFVEGFELSFEVQPSADPKAGSSMGASVSQVSHLKLHTYGGQLAKMNVGARVASLELQTVVTGTVSKLATFGNLTVVKVGATIGGLEGEEEIELQPRELDVFSGSSRLHVDLVKNTQTFVGTCATPVYAHGSPDLKLPAGNTPIQSAALEVSTPESESAKAGTADVSVGAPKLDLFAVELPFDMNGLCAMKDLRAGKTTAKTSVIDYRAPENANEKPVIERLWDACLSVPRVVRITGGGMESPMAHIELGAGGVVRKEADGVWGWSFVTNKPITSCDAVR